ARPVSCRPGKACRAHSRSGIPRLDHFHQTGRLYQLCPSYRWRPAGEDRLVESCNERFQARVSWFSSERPALNSGTGLAEQSKAESKRAQELVEARDSAGLEQRKTVEEINEGSATRTEDDQLVPCWTGPETEMNSH